MKPISNISVCPYCKSEEKTYEKEYIDDNALIFPFTCDNCHKKSQDVYILEYEQTEGCE